MKPQPPTSDPRHKWKPCFQCGERDWFYGTRRYCQACKDRWAETPEAKQKRSAQQALANAVRDGKLVRQPCVVCTKNGRTQFSTSHGHHEDYSKPLDVIWLCPMHHRWAHASRRAEVVPAFQPEPSTGSKHG